MAGFRWLCHLSKQVYLNMGEKAADIFSLYDERKKKYKTIIYKHINSAAPSRQKMIVCIVGELITE